MLEVKQLSKSYNGRIALDGVTLGISILLNGHGVSGVVAPLMVLLAFSAVFSFVAAAKFRFEETKIYLG